MESLSFQKFGDLKGHRVIWVVCIIFQSFLINWIFVTEVERRVRIFFVWRFIDLEGKVY